MCVFVCVCATTLTLTYFIIHQKLKFSVISSSLSPILLVYVYELESCIEYIMYRVMCTMSLPQRIVFDPLYTLY